MQVSSSFPKPRLFKSSHLTLKAGPRLHLIQLAIPKSVSRVPRRLALHSNPKCDGRHLFPDSQTKKAPTHFSAIHTGGYQLAAAIYSRLKAMNSSRRSRLCSAVPNASAYFRQPPFDTILRFKPSAGSTALSAGYNSNKRIFYAGFKGRLLRNRFQSKAFSAQGYQCVTSATQRV